MIPWGVLITGIVGVGGTALGAWLNGRMQTKTLRLGINAENERARLAERRRVYAHSLAAIDKLHMTGVKEVAYRGKVPNDALMATIRERFDALNVLHVVVSELELIATGEVWRLVNQIVPLLLDYQNLNQVDYQRLRNGLRVAMRADLGEWVPGS
jgi:hypothetical protein